MVYMAFRFSGDGELRMHGNDERISLENCARRDLRRIVIE
jgi:hypothetical protein